MLKVIKINKNINKYFFRNCFIYISNKTLGSYEISGNWTRGRGLKVLDNIAWLTTLIMAMWAKNPSDLKTVSTTKRDAGSNPTGIFWQVNENKIV